MLFGILYLSILLGIGLGCCVMTRKSDEEYLVKLLKENKLYFEGSILD